MKVNKATSYVTLHGRSFMYTLNTVLHLFDLYFTHAEEHRNMLNNRLHLLLFFHTRLELVL